MLKLKDIANKIDGKIFELRIKRKDNLMYDLIEVWVFNFDEMIKKYGEREVFSISTDDDGFLTIFVEEE